MTNRQMRLCGVAIITVVMLGVSSCDREHPADGTNAKTEHSTDAAREKADRAAESAGEKVNRAAESAGKTVEQASEKLATTAKEAASKTANTLDDAAVTTKVRAALYAEPGLKMLQLDVTTNSGVVTLAGSVDSEALHKRAVQIAGSLNGVNQVVDKLVVKSS